MNQNLFLGVKDLFFVNYLKYIIADRYNNSKLKQKLIK
jgi:hypothetical protein